MQIDGPYSFKEVDGLKTPVYIYLPGGKREDIGEVTVKIDGGMTFDVRLDSHEEIEMASFDVPMRFTYLNLPDKPKIIWRWNCLTQGPYDGHPDAIWNIPLLQAVNMFTCGEIEQLVVARIYNDAMQFVEHGVEPRPPKQEWAEKTRDLAQEKFFGDILQTKIREITEYYHAPRWRRDVQDVIERVKTDKLNPGYKPLHGHDSINMLCRIIGVGSSIEASKEFPG